MAFNVALGFLAGALVAPLTGRAPESTTRTHTPETGDAQRVPADEEGRTRLDALMKESAK